MDYFKLSQHIKTKLFEVCENGKDHWPIVCQLHGIFDNSDYLVESNSDAGSSGHNCLGCNFSEYTWGLLRTVESWSVYKNHPDISSQSQMEDFYPTSNFFHWLDVLIDSYEELLKFIDIKESRRLKLFPVFQRIKPWANFFKHPKAMILTHHATYIFEATPELNRENILVEKDIAKYYSNTNNDGTLLNRLTNKAEIFVQFPDLFMIIDEFSEATKFLISLLKDNKLFRDELAQKSTIVEYYKKTDAEALEKSRN
jgi:hypothetical protein